jgi:hypothetical protein
MGTQTYPKTLNPKPCFSFSFSLLFGPLFATFKPHNFLIFLFFLNQLKCYRNTTWSFTNHLRTLIATKQLTNIYFLGVQEPTS